MFKLKVSEILVIKAETVRFFSNNKLFAINCVKVVFHFFIR